MGKILILFAHPALEKSRVNSQLIKGLKELDSITFRDLYQVYPELDIDVEREQALVEEHDIIIFHHPFFWYNVPAMLKEWQDLVLRHGWAYGNKGNALKGKFFFNVITTGGQKQAYCEKGYNNFTLRQLLAPMQQTANLCKMIFLPPYVIHGTHAITPEAIQAHKKAYHNILILLRDEKMDFSRLISSQYMNDYLE